MHMTEPRHPNRFDYYDEEDYDAAVERYIKRREDYEIWCDMEFDRRRDAEMERAIRFNDEMVRAILDGRKTQTRRPIKPQPGAGMEHILSLYQSFLSRGREKYGDIGDDLWVQEVFAINLAGNYDYRATVHPEYYPDFTWRSSTQMPREASRIDLSITGLRIERVQDISEDDAISEGVEYLTNGHDTPVCRIHYPIYGADGMCVLEGYCECGNYTNIEVFASIWDFIYAKKGYSWESNPWVYVIDFKVMNDPGKGR